MINPDDRVPQDDTDDEDKEDQMSQNDIHSNGFDEYDEPLDDDNIDESAALKQAYDASESAFTLDFDDEDEDDVDDE